MKITQGNISRLTILIILIILALVISPVIFNLQVRGLKNEEAALRDEITAFARLRDGVPSKEKLTHYIIRREALNNKYESIKDEFGTLLKSKEPTFSDPLKFKQSLLASHNKLRSEAAELGIKLPDSLGLEEYYDTIPPSEKVPELFMQLEVIKALVELTTASGINTLKSIELEDPVIMSGVSSYREFPFTLTVECTIQDMVRFLYSLRKQNVLFIIRNLKINTTEEEAEELVGELSISSIIFI